MFEPARWQIFSTKETAVFSGNVYSLMNIHSKIVISFSPPPTHSGFLLPNPRAVSALNTSICSSEGTHWDLTYPCITSLTHGKTKPIRQQFHSQEVSPVTSDLRYLICLLRNHFAIYNHTRRHWTKCCLLHFHPTHSLSLFCPMVEDI